MRIAANSPDTFPFSGRRKLPIFASPLINPPDKLKQGVAIYRDTLAGSPGDTALAFPIHVTTSRAQARQDCEAGLMRFLRVAVELVRPADQADFKSFEAFRQVLARFEQVKYDDFDREIGVIRGSGLLRRASAGASARIWDRRVHLLLQARRDHGSHYGQTIDDGVRPRGDAALPLAARR
jgi:hypothetical protein